MGGRCEPLLPMHLSVLDSSLRRWMWNQRYDSLHSIGVSLLPRMDLHLLLLGAQARCPPAPPAKHRDRTTADTTARGAVRSSDPGPAPSQRERWLPVRGFKRKANVLFYVGLEFESVSCHALKK